MTEEKLQKRRDNAKINLDMVEEAMFLLENTQPTVGRYNGE